MEKSRPIDDGRASGHNELFREAQEIAKMAERESSEQILGTPMKMEDIKYELRNIGTSYVHARVVRPGEDSQATSSSSGDPNLCRVNASHERLPTIDQDEVHEVCKELTASDGSANAAFVIEHRRSQGSCHIEGLAVHYGHG